MIVMDKGEKISSSTKAAEIFKKVLEMRQCEDKHKECFYAMGLNACNTILYIDLITMGTVNMSHVAIREVVRMAIIKNAVGVILCHNHPSGNITPSQQDIKFTSEIKKACELLGLSMLDHIIIGEGFYSFTDRGLICS